MPQAVFTRPHDSKSNLPYPIQKVFWKENGALTQCIPQKSVNEALRLAVVITKKKKTYKVLTGLSSTTKWLKEELFISQSQ